LFERLGQDDAFPLSVSDLAVYLHNSQRYAGAAVQQTQEYLRDIVVPKLHTYEHILGDSVITMLTV
jgi:hypothetical protein